jgi:hypothetical protein
VVGKMKKKLLKIYSIGAAFTLLLVTPLPQAISVISSTFSTVKMYPDQLNAVDNTHILFVDDNGDEQFDNIQKAIDASSNGDTIFVYGGLYKENIHINHPIELIGEDKHSTLIDAGQRGHGVFIISSKVTIRNFKIFNGSSVNDPKDYHGVVINSHGGKKLRYVKIDNCIITENQNGISLTNPLTEIVDISHCNISNNYGHGIDSQDADIHEIVGCVISNNEEGIHLRDTVFTIIMESIITYNQKTGIYIEGTRAQNCALIMIVENHIAYNGGLGIIFHGGVNFVYVQQNNFKFNNLGKTKQVTFNLVKFFTILWFNANHWDPDGDGNGKTPYVIWGDFSGLPKKFTDTNAQKSPYPIPDIF